MSEENLSEQHTQHAFLVAWGWFAQNIGLIQAIHSAASSRNQRGECTADLWSALQSQT